MNDAKYVFRVRVNVENGAYYYIGEAYTTRALALAHAHDVAEAVPSYETRKALGIVGITIEPLRINAE